MDKELPECPPSPGCILCTHTGASGIWFQVGQIVQTYFPFDLTLIVAGIV